MRDFAERNGISLSALVESIGILTAELGGVDGYDELREAIVGKARQVDASRRVRTR
jgi:hypothetical protein